jgi:hypothetical protein
MDQPAETASFADRLDWLLATVRHAPGTDGRFSEDLIVGELAATAPSGRLLAADTTALAEARDWLVQMRTGTADPSTADRAVT